MAPGSVLPRNLPGCSLSHILPLFQPTWASCSHIQSLKSQFFQKGGQADTWNGLNIQEETVLLCRRRTKATSKAHTRARQWYSPVREDQSKYMRNLIIWLMLYKSHSPTLTHGFLQQLCRLGFTIPVLQWNWSLRSQVTCPRSQLMERQYQKAQSHLLSFSPVGLQLEVLQNHPGGCF